MYAPYWMMDALGVDEGGQIHIESVLAIPKGIYCQFQPDELEFLDVAAQFGPKASDQRVKALLMPCLDSFVMMEYGNQRYKLKVVDVKPASVVHLFGDVDLEVDFKMPEVRLSSSWSLISH
ncbi:unnamed protein product [Aphanomyces euteiches]